jgi:hypothetical protein
MSAVVRPRQLSFDEIWNELEAGIRQALARETMTTTRYMELYTYCYNYCARSNENGKTPPSTAVRVRGSGRSALGLQKAVYSGQELYVRLRSLIEEHLRALTVVSPSPSL